VGERVAAEQRDARRECEERSCAEECGGPIVDGLRRYVAGSPNRLVFDERHIGALQRLVVENARDVAGDELSDHNRATLLTCLVAMGDVLPEDSRPNVDVAGDYDVDAWTAYIVRSGAYYDQPYSFEAIAGTHAMLVQIAGEPDLRDHQDLCPLDDWAVAGRCGGALADQVTGP